VSNIVDGNIVAVAEAIRCQAQQTEPPFSLPEILEGLCLNAVVAEHDLPDGIEEIVSVTADGPLVILRRDLVLSERRFAIAHAIAHLVYDLPALTSRSGRITDEDREIRADWFARELLAPRRCVRPRIVYWPDGVEIDIYDDQLARLASRFQVPSRAIDQQIRELERDANSWTQNRLD
jgi:Zn-dependent peptidase ImmA (M78 family)